MDGPPPVVVGLDVGTTSVKALVVDRSGEIVGSGTSPPIETSTPVPGASEQRPEHIWRAVGVACADALAAPERAPGVRGVAMAAQSGSVVPMRGTEPAGRAVTWMDMRAAPLVASWGGSVKDLVRRTSGWTPSAGLGLATITWLRSIGAAEVVDRWASVDDYLVWRLCGRWLTNPSNAAGMQLMDGRTLTWSPELCRLTGVEEIRLSSIRPSGTSAGAVTPAAAAGTGLPASTPVVVGGHDQACAALGLGAVTSGSTVLSLGTAWVLTITSSDRTGVERLPSSFNTSPHVVSGSWSVSTNLGGLGAVIDRALAEAGAAAPMLDAGLRSSGDRQRPFFFLDLDGWGRFSRDPGDPVERLDAVLEACAFEVRRAIDVAADAGLEPAELTVVGGATRSERLLSLLAGVLDFELTIRPDASWPAVGAARLGARALGWPDEVATDRLSAEALLSPPDVRRELNVRYLAHASLRTGASP